MSSRFISAGSIDPTTGEATTANPSHDQPPSPQPPTAKQLAWASATADLETARRQREEARLRAQSGANTEKTLYETLQANKAAKQAAFEEASRLKNQFRALDEDEVEFWGGREEETGGGEREEGEGVVGG
ncbi:hypothetical protein N0V88_002811 [Collariella sp. IMI 366227]|nr:hypothetical protein N0V88_002811 [Collariella sp. IMI 366227]